MKIVLLVLLFFFVWTGCVHINDTYWSAKPFKYWSKKRLYCILATSFWSVSITLAGLSFVLTGQIAHITTMMLGMSCLCMLPVPCSTPIINTNKLLWPLRQLMFLILGVLLILA